MHAAGASDMVSLCGNELAWDVWESSEGMVAQTKAGGGDRVHKSLVKEVLVHLI